MGQTSTRTVLDAGQISRPDLLDAIRRLYADGQPRTVKYMATELAFEGITVGKNLVGSVLTVEGRGEFVYDRVTNTYEPTLKSPAPASVQDVVGQAWPPATTNTSKGPDVIAPPQAPRMEEHVSQINQGAMSARQTPAKDSSDGKGQLLYLSESLWLSIPEWAEFYVTLGSFVASQNTTAGSPRSVVGLAIPTRAYAATFAAVGVVRTRSVTGQASLDAQAHFEKLSRLPKGTMLTYMPKDKQLVAMFDGVEQVADGPRIRVQLEKKRSDYKIQTGRTVLLNSQQSLKVEVAPDPNKKLPSAQGGKVGRKVDGTGFIGGFLGDLDMETFIMRCRLECAVIGKRSVFLKETCETTLAVTCSGGKREEGTVQDVIRVRDFLSSADAYWTDFYPVTGQNPAVPDRDCIAPVAIFDGAAAFIKWREHWRQSHWIVLLDRTDPHFLAASAALDDEYLRRSNTDPIPPPLSFPVGVDIVLYEEARR